jgi:hypothetical protein
VVAAVVVVDLGFVVVFSNETIFVSFSYFIFSYSFVWLLDVTPCSLVTI